MSNDIDQLSCVHPSYFHWTEIKDEEPLVDRRLDRLPESNWSAKANTKALYLTIFILQCGFTLAVVLGLQSGLIISSPESVKVVYKRPAKVNLASIEAQLEDVSKILSVVVPAVTGKRMDVNGKEHLVSVVEPQRAIAIVASEKVGLRLSPRGDAKVLSELKKGSQLIIIGKQGSWLEVFSPKGERAWVLAKAMSQVSGALL